VGWVRVACVGRTMGRVRSVRGMGGVCDDLECCMFEYRFLYFFISHIIQLTPQEQSAVEKLCRFFCCVMLVGGGVAISSGWLCCCGDTLVMWGWVGLILYGCRKVVVWLV